MERLKFNDYETFAFAVSCRYDDLEDEFDDVTIVAKYDATKEIIKELIYLGHDINSIKITKPDLDEYNGEYVISIFEDAIRCEPMKNENGYIQATGEVIYVMDSCSSKVIPHCIGGEIYEVSVGIEECECPECKCNRYEKPVVKETYSVNGEKVTKEEFDKKYNEFEDKYLDAIQNVLQKHLELQREVDEWRKLLGW